MPRHGGVHTNALWSFSPGAAEVQSSLRRLQVKTKVTVSGQELTRAQSGA